MIDSNERWYEMGLGFRTRIGPLYRLLRFIPGVEGDRAYLDWIHTFRVSQERQTKIDFDGVVTKLDSESIALDLGANLGEVTDLLARSGAEVHSFEPEPHLFQHLTDRFAGRPNIVLHNAAISAQAGTIKFWLQDGVAEDPFSCQSHSIVSGSWDSSGGQTIDVECIDFFDFCSGLRRKPDLIKMDIEGAEVEILERLLTEFEIDEFPALFVETHERQFPTLRSRLATIHKQIRTKNIRNINLLWP